MMPLLAQTAQATSEYTTGSVNWAQFIVSLVISIGIAILVGKLAELSGHGFRAAFCVTFFGPSVYVFVLIVMLYQDNAFAWRNLKALVLILFLFPFIVAAWYLLLLLWYAMGVKYRGRKAINKSAPVPSYSAFDMEETGSAATGPYPSCPPDQYVLPPQVYQGSPTEGRDRPSAPSYSQSQDFHNQQTVAANPGGAQPRHEIQSTAASNASGAEGTLLCLTCGSVWTEDYVYCGDCGSALARR